MKLPNGYGTVKKLSGNRRKPYGAYITTEYTLQKKAPSIDFLKDILSPELYKALEKEYNQYTEKQPYIARQVQKPIGYYATKKEGLIALAEYNKKPFDLSASNVTFEDVYKILHDTEFKKKSKASFTVYTTAYKKCSSLYRLKMKDIRVQHLQSVIDEYANTSLSNQSNIIILFHAIFKYCLMNDICEKDYSKFVKVGDYTEKKKKTPYSKEEIKILWDNLDWIAPTGKSNTLYNTPLVDSIIIMIYTGMRIGELLSLKKEDVHLSDRWIDLHGTKTKAAKRAVPIHRDIVPLFEKRLRDNKSEYIFYNSKLNLISPTLYRQTFLQPFNNFTNMVHTPHECRHTFISIAMMSDINKMILKKIVGHASADITEDVYTHAYLSDLIKEIDKVTF